MATLNRMKPGLSLPSVSPPGFLEGSIVKKAESSNSVRNRYCGSLLSRDWRLKRRGALTNGCSFVPEALTGTFGTKPSPNCVSRPFFVYAALVPRNLTSISKKGLPSLPTSLSDKQRPQARKPSHIHRVRPFVADERRWRRCCRCTPPYHHPPSI